MELIQQVVTAGGLIGVPAAALLWLRRKGWVGLAARTACGGRRRQLEPVDRLHLGPQHSLHLVRVGGCCALIGVSPSGVTMLKEFAMGEFGGEAPDSRGGAADRGEVR